LALHARRLISWYPMAYLRIADEELETGDIMREGRFAVVFQGRYHGTVVSLKRYSLPLQPQMLESEISAQREIAALAVIRSQRVVLLYGVCESPGSLCLVTEWCWGGDLFCLLHNTFDELSHSQRVKVCADTAAAGSYLHGLEHLIMHRDLNSKNLLLAGPVSSQDDPLSVKVSDFGVARIRDAPSAPWPSMTRDVGDVHWRAPEAQTRRYDEKIDVYSYGMVMYETLFSRIPWEDFDVDSVGALVMSGVRPVLDQNLDAKLEQLMVACWSHRPATRPSFDRVTAYLAEEFESVLLGH